jgi:hypothetical protein
MAFLWGRSVAIQSEFSSLILTWRTSVVDRPTWRIRSIFIPTPQRRVVQECRKNDRYIKPCLYREQTLFSAIYICIYMLQVTHCRTSRDHTTTPHDARLRFLCSHTGAMESLSSSWASSWVRTKGRNPEIKWTKSPKSVDEPGDKYPVNAFFHLQCWCRSF